MNHTRFPKEDHLPDWVCLEDKVTKGDLVEGESLGFSKPGFSFCKIMLRNMNVVSKTYLDQRQRKPTIKFLENNPYPANVENMVRS